ncbi:MAG: hypothetical protein HY815_05080, partial [Candidatus Riflebacteria bacterium]|nr:hypothetical protein [Candidatus Riflebacteria bacterium]
MPSEVAMCIGPFERRRGRFLSVAALVALLVLWASSGAGLPVRVIRGSCPRHARPEGRVPGAALLCPGFQPTVDCEVARLRISRGISHQTAGRIPDAVSDYLAAIRLTTRPGRECSSGPGAGARAVAAGVEAEALERLLTVLRAGPVHPILAELVLTQTALC